MKKPLVDITKLEIQSYLQEVAFINKFIRLWGTQVVNGVEVLNARNYFLLRAWEQFNMHPAYVPKAGEVCTPETKTVCEQIIVGYESDNEGNTIYDELGNPTIKYKEQCRTTFVSDKTATVYRRPPICTRERKLLEYIGFWGQAKAQSTKGLNQMWLCLSPAKLMDVYADIDKDNTVDAIKRNMERYLTDKADIQGRVRLKAQIVTSNEFIPGLDGQQFSEQELNIAGFNQSEVLQEEVWITEEVLVNGVPTVVNKLFPVYLKDVEGKYVKDKDGKLTQIGTEYRKQLENVTSYTNMKSTIQTLKDFIWNHNLVISTSGTPEDMYEELLTRYLLVHGDQSKIRLELVQKSTIQYTREENYESPIWGNYNSYLNGINVSYRGTNSGSGYSYEVTYNIPVYEVTMVVRDYEELSTTLVSKIKADIFADYYKKMCTDENGYSYECPDQQLGLAIMGNGELVAATYGKVNGFSSYRSVRRLYQEPDDPDNAAFVAGYESMYYDVGGSAEGTYTGPTDWWVLAPGYGHRGSNLPWLKVDVLRGKIGGLKRKDRIKLIGAIIDVGWWEKKKKSGGFLSFVVVVIAVVVAVIIPPISLYLIVNVAAAIVAFAAVISIGAAVLLSTGNYGDAKWLAELNKTISPVVQVAGLVLIVYSIYNFTQSFSNFAASTANMTAEQVVSKIVSSAAEKISTMTLSDGLRFASRAFDLYAKNDINQKTKELESKQKKLQELLEINEESKYRDVYREFASVMMNPLLMQGSSFEFDRQFEPVFGSMHTGNSCRTSTMAVMGDGATTYFRNVV